MQVIKGDTDVPQYILQYIPLLWGAVDIYGGWVLNTRMGGGYKAPEIKFLLCGVCAIFCSNSPKTSVHVATGIHMTTQSLEFHVQRTFC